MRTLRGGGGRHQVHEHDGGHADGATASPAVSAPSGPVDPAAGSSAKSAGSSTASAKRSRTPVSLLVTTPRLYRVAQAWTGSRGQI